jgi:probable HAF family extracellular repeat protein
MVAVRSCPLLALLLVGLVLSSPVNAESSWSAVDIGFVGNSDAYGYMASGLNNLGQVIGSYVTSTGDTHGFITGSNGSAIMDLGTLPGFSDSYALGINGSGRVVGYASTPDSSLGAHAFITGPNGVGMADLGVLQDAAFSQAFGINAAGQVVGASGNLDTGGVKAFTSGANGSALRPLGTPDGLTAVSVGGGINSAGQVAGYYSRDDLDMHHAFITAADGAGLRDLGALPGDDFSEAHGLNESGMVVGLSLSANGGGSAHAFITGPNGLGLRDLGTLGGSGSYADGLNGAGQVVGYSALGDETLHAFITGPDGVGMVDVNSLVTLAGGAYFTEASGVNDLGQLVANSSDGHAYLLTQQPIPEPGTGAQMLLGLGLLGGVLRRQRSATA